MPTPIIIDCDPGHDDAIAILLAIANSEKLDLRGITTVGGNQILDKITENALKVISFVNADIPVAKGLLAHCSASLLQVRKRMVNRAWMGRFCPQVNSAL